MISRLLIIGVLALELVCLAAANESRATTMDSTMSTPPFLGFVTSDAGGAVWYVEHSGIGRLDTHGHFTHFHVPQLQLGAVDLAASADGSMWFTRTGSVGRISRDGA